MNRRFKYGKILMAALLMFPAFTAWTQQTTNQQTTGSPGAAQTPTIHEFSLAQAIDYASKNSVMVKNALLDLQIQEQSNRATTSEALPQITGSAGITDYLQLPTTVVPGGTFIPNSDPNKLYGFSFGTQYTSNYGVTLKQILFDGQVFVGLQARQTSLDFYRKKQEVTEQMLRANVEKIYYQLLIAKTQIDQIDANITSQQELLHNSTEMFKNGFAEQLDVDKASVQLANLETEKVQVELNISNGYLGLKVLMGMPVNDSLRLTDSLTYDMIRNQVLGDDYKYSDRRDYQLLQLNKKLNEYDISRYKKMYIPTASLTANYGQTQYSRDLDLFRRGSWYPSSYVGLNISVPIFDGFFKDANIKQAKLRLRQTENNIDSLKIRVDNDVRQAQLRFAAALTTLDFQRKNMELSDKVYMQTRKKYDQGLGSNIEITTAFADQRVAQANYFNALYNAVVARVDYLNAIGKL